LGVNPQGARKKNIRQKRRTQRRTDRGKGEEEE
jgi:hypothetical protein